MFRSNGFSNPEGDLSLFFYSSPPLPMFVSISFYGIERTNAKQLKPVVPPAWIVIESERKGLFQGLPFIRLLLFLQPLVGLQICIALVEELWFLCI